MTKFSTISLYLKKLYVTNNNSVISHILNSEICQNSALSILTDPSAIYLDLDIINAAHLLLDHAVLGVRVLDVVSEEAGPIEHSLEVPQRDPTQRLAHTRHEGRRRPDKKTDIRQKNTFSIVAHTIVVVPEIL